MPTIDIDDAVYDYIKKNIIDFNETPNSVLRRLFGLDQNDKRIRTHSDGHFTVTSNATPIRKATRRPAARLSVLTRAGILKEGQTLYLYLYEDPLCEATIAGDKLIWNGDEYSMSRLALEFFKKAGLSSEAVRGPLYWYAGTDDEAPSIAELWERYLDEKNRG